MKRQEMFNFLKGDQGLEYGGFQLKPVNLLETVKKMNERVGRKPYALPAFELVTGGSPLQLKGLDIAPKGNLMAQISFAGENKPIVLQQNCPECDDIAVAPPADHVYGSFRLTGKLGLGASGESSTGGNGSVAAQVDFEKGFSYAHYRPILPSQSMADATNTLLARAQWLADLDFNGLTEGEIHVFSGNMSIDFGLEASRGFAAKLAGQLFGTLPARGSFEANVKAALGLGLSQAMRLVVIRLGGEKSNWVRIRFERQNHHRLTFGATFAVIASYNLGDGLVTLLDRTLEHDSFAGVMRIMRDLKELQPKIVTLAAATPEQLKQELKQRLGAEIYDRLSQMVGVERLINSEAIQKLVGAANRIVSEFDGLEGRIQSVLARLLGRTVLGSQSSLLIFLNKVAGLDPDKLQLANLVPEYREDIGFLEIMLGQDIESLLLGDLADLQAAARQARDGARTILNFLSAETIAGQIGSWIRRYEEAFGITNLVTFLRQVPNLADLNGYVRERGAAMMEKLSGKLVAQIDNDDLQKMIDFAKRLAPLLEDVTGMEQRLRDQLQQLHGRVGLSLGIEISRVVSRERILDLEIDTTRPENQAALEAVRRLHLGDTVRSLPDGDGYILRESALTSEKIRSSAFTFIFACLFARKTRKAIEGLHVEAHQDGATIVRKGTYTGRFIQTFEAGDASETAPGQATMEWLSEIAIQARVTGVGKTLLAPFNDQPSLGLCLKIFRGTQSMQPAENAGTVAMLNMLGFRFPSDIAWRPDKPTKITIEIRLDADWVQAFLKLLAAGDGARDTDLLSAAQAWYLDAQVDRRDTSFPKAHQQRGPLLAKVIGSTAYLKRWRDIASQRQFVGNAHKPTVFRIKAGTRTFTIQATKETSLGGLATARHFLPPAFAKAAKALQVTQLRNEHPNLEMLTRCFTRAAAKAAPMGWPSPMYPVLLLLATISHHRPELLAKARGVATLRWTDDEGREQVYPLLMNRFDPAPLKRAFDLI